MFRFTVGGKYCLKCITNNSYDREESNGDAVKDATTPLNRLNDAVTADNAHHYQETHFFLVKYSHQPLHQAEWQPNSE